MIRVTVRLSQVIAPAFAGVHEDVKAGRHTHYWLKGGRGSAKSSFISAEIVLSIMRDGAAGRFTNAIVLRRYGVTIRESVYEQLGWAVNALGVSHLWQMGISPMQLTYLPTGQKILFRGVDDPTKLKSVKAGKGYLKYVWYEEVNEFEGPAKIQSVNQSVLRGGNDFAVFYSFNPPASAGNWVNRYVETEREDTLVHHSTYLTVPRQWLGETFLAEAEHAKQTRPEAYRHEYLGEVTGTGGEVFANVTLRPITDQEIKGFDRLRRGLDWGYAADPFAYNTAHYDKTRRRLYIFFEIHRLRLSNREATRLILAEAGNGRIICDSAEPKSIDEVRGYGLRVYGAKKGPDSVDYGVKWLQDLEEIVIDPLRCPQTAREFREYELDRDKEGNFKAGFPDRDNHHIDAMRYACEEDITGPKFSFH